MNKIQNRLERLEENWKDQKIDAINTEVIDYNGIIRTK
jgi:hypothetical protein